MIFCLEKMRLKVFFPRKGAVSFFFWETQIPSINRVDTLRLPGTGLGHAESRERAAQSGSRLAGGAGMQRKSPGVAGAVPRRRSARAAQQQQTSRSRRAAWRASNNGDAPGRPRWIRREGSAEQDCAPHARSPAGGAQSRSCDH